MNDWLASAWNRKSGPVDAVDGPEVGVYARGSPAKNVIDGSTCRNGSTSEVLNSVRTIEIPGVLKKAGSSGGHRRREDRAARAGDRHLAAPIVGAGLVQQADVGELAGEVRVAEVARQDLAGEDQLAVGEAGAGQVVGRDADAVGQVVVVDLQEAGALVGGGREQRRADDRRPAGDGCTTLTLLTTSRNRATTVISKVVLSPMIEEVVAGRGAQLGLVEVGEGRPDVVRESAGRR